ncbi:12370_t:CDS:2, partial [Funneliformis caledonium]
SGHLCMCLAIINRGLQWYLEDIQDRDDQNNLQYEFIEIETQFQQDSNGNHELLVADLHILNQLRASDTFTADVKQRVQRKEKYAYGIPLHTYDVSNHRQDNDHIALDDIGKNT